MDSFTYQLDVPVADDSKPVQGIHALTMEALCRPESTKVIVVEFEGKGCTCGKEKKYAAQLNPDSYNMTYLANFTVGGVAGFKADSFLALYRKNKVLYVLPFFYPPLLPLYINTNNATFNYIFIPTTGHQDLLPSTRLLRR